MTEPIVISRRPQRTTGSALRRGKKKEAPGVLVPARPPLRPIAPWTPWAPQQPPAGSYDPNIDINLGGAHRGFRDLTEDVLTQQTRGTSDYLRGFAGIQQGAQRGFADLLTGRAQETENYGLSTADLSRTFERLGRGQLQRQNAAGVLGGSAQRQSSVRRAENRGLEQGRLDLGHGRFMDASRLAETRLGEDTGFDAGGRELGSLPLNSALAKLRLEMAPPDASNPLGGRLFQDLTTQLARGGREDSQADIDAAKVRGAQAAASGWNPSVKPKNEFVGPDGKPYRTRTVGNFVVAYGPGGKVLWKKRRPGELVLA